MRALANKVAFFITTMTSSFFSGITYANTYSAYNLTEGVTNLSKEVYDLHMAIFYICCVIAVVVFGVMFYALLRHRKSLGVKPATFHENTTVEILWTIIPLLILVGMAIPATRVLKDMYNTADSELTVEIIGHQWRWQYKYLDSGIEFFSSLSTSSDAMNNLVPKGEHYLREVDNPLVLPTNTKIRFLFASQDVQHAWWVPDLGFKRDTIPGFINENWAVIKHAGTYRGQCAELCGVLHGFMPIVVEAKSPEDFAKWVAEKSAPPQTQTADKIVEASTTTIRTTVDSSPTSSTTTTRVTSDATKTPAAPVVPAPVVAPAPAAPAAQTPSTTVTVTTPAAPATPVTVTPAPAATPTTGPVHTLAAPVDNTNKTETNTTSR